MDALELIVDEGRPANAVRFFQLGHDLLALLDELSEFPVMWQVADLGMGSAKALIAPPETASGESRWLRLVHGSLGGVQAGGALSDEWSPDAVRAAHRFVEHGQPIEGEQDWVPPRLRLVTDTPGNDRSVDLTPELGGQLAVLQPFERRMPGSVRGTRASLRLPNKRIVRVGFETSLRNELKDAMYQQVELSGLVRQDGDGRVFHVRAADATVLAKPEVRWSDLFGMDPEFTGHLTTEEYLEAHRGEA